MKRFFQIGLFALASAIVVPLAMSAAIAQTALQMPRIVEALDLTEEQQQQVRSIFAARRSEIEEILTDEQQQQFRAAYQELQDFRGAVAAIDDLTDDQKSAVRTVVQASREDFSEVLTDEQIAELRSIVRERRQLRR